ncbi:hypothetical protein AK812_SmicGene43673 [Symbiodinium microadriaticum]|uniref:Uncharacterized protein n=1 Tax=Symbiodinium microadriaticum TaxID=2951 RepID=A0A1Q9C0E8_SYMMI|nr:hypothetical protein AK812_SmicGene43673 [Symbiodinium microadriaticum]
MEVIKSTRPWCAGDDRLGGGGLRGEGVYKRPGGKENDCDDGDICESSNSNSKTIDLKTTADVEHEKLNALDAETVNWMSPWNKPVALPKLRQRTLPLERWLVLVKQNKSLIPVRQWIPMRQWVPMRQKALPLERRFSDIIDYDDSGESVGLLLKSVAHAKAHLFLLCEVSLPHEALASMFIDCLFYQVDLIGGDPNRALYRYSGTKQGSMDIHGGMHQSILTYFLDGWKHSPRCMPFCIPPAQHCSANSLLLLKQYEDALGGRAYRDCPAIDWKTFPGLDPMVATVLEWGHSMTDDQWTEFPADTKEFKLSVSEWLPNSTSANYLLNDRDYDSHVPLLLTVNSKVFTPGSSVAEYLDFSRIAVKRRNWLVQQLFAGFVLRD